MIKQQFSTTTDIGIVKTTARLAIVFSALFLAIISLLHFLEPEFDPSWRMISEYEIGRYGWMMRLAFFCWGLSVLALLIALWPSLRGASGTIGRWWLLFIVIALFGAGIFVTNAITDDMQSTENTLHTLSGAIVILTFPVAAFLVARTLGRNQEWKAYQRGLFWLTLLVWFGMLVYFASIIISNAINPAVGRVGPQVYQGWPNRFMVVVYHTWLIFVASRAIKISR